MFNPMQSSKLCYLELTNGHFVANAKLTTMVEVAVTQTYMLVWHVISTEFRSFVLKAPLDEYQRKWD